MVFAIFLHAGAAHSQPNAAASNAESHRVLILSPSGQGAPGQDLYIRTLVDSLKSTGVNGDDIYVEYLDLVRNPGARYRETEKNLLKEKFRKRKVDLVITILQTALDFFLLESPELAPNATVLVVRGELAPDLPRGAHKFVLLNESLDYQESLKQALTLFPKTRNVVISIGSTTDAHWALRAAMPAGAPLRNKLNFTDTSNMTIEEAKKYVASLPANSIIFGLGMRGDKTERTFVRAESNETILRSANAPVFLVYDIDMGKGYIGGYLFSIKNEGVRAATIAFEIMNGTFTPNEPVLRLNAEQVSIYDWQQLVRWKADPDRLPRDTIFINRPPSIWDQHRQVVVVTVCAFLLLSILIAALLWQIRRKTLIEEALTSNQERYRTLVEEAPEAIIMYDVDQHRLIELNSKAERLFERSREDLLHIDPRRLYLAPAGDEKVLSSSFEDNSRRALAGESLVYERTVRTRSGKEIPCEIWLSRLPAKDRNLLRASIIDITERKNAETELLRHRQKLEEQVAERTAALSVALDQAQSASRAKSTFLSHMSHEIRTPMNAILGYTQLMERLPELTGKLKDYTAVIAKSGDHLMSLINDVLEMSKIEAGGVTLSQEDFNVRALLRDVESMFKMRAAEKNLQLDIVIAESMPEQLFADATKVRQILVNLIGNAIKFTDHGRVEVKAAARMDDGQGVAVELEVADTGPGIPEHEQSRVFEAFEQTTSGFRKGGTGLGMAISREYARIMAGDVSLESVPGRGTTVRFTFSALPGKNGAANAARSENKRVAALAPHSVQPRILIVDDIESNRDILRLMLSDIGIGEMRESAEGKDAVALVSEWRPDIVLLDRRMPGMDGLDVARAIRTLPEGGKVRIVMVTASAFEEDRRLAFAAGVDGFVGKPFHEQEIFSEIQRVFPGIAYRYEDETALARKENGNGHHAAELAKLDGKLIAELIELIESGDVLRFENRLVEHVRGEFPDLYDYLHELVQRFDYARILAMLKPVGSIHEAR